MTVEFFDVVRKRQSIRRYTSAPLEEDKLKTILDAANRAPSAGNLQAYEIYIARDASHRRALAQASLSQMFVADAPVVLVFCTHPGRAAREYGQRGSNLYALQDATIACAFAMLTATAMGLGTVWIGAFDDTKVRHVIGAPEEYQPVAMLPVGYSADRPQSTSRRRLGDLVHEISG
jgi:nitroreductase